MNLDEYQEVTGRTVSEEQQPAVEATLRRSGRTLEKLLGFTLNPDKIQENIYNETGKLPNYDFWSYPNVDISKLLPADDVVGAYRLYQYNPYDKFFFTDPFTAVHAVKLVYIMQGYTEDSSITIKTFTNSEVRPQYGKDGMGKYIEHNCKPWWMNYQHLQLAVDADWAFQDCAPDDLKDIWADMVSTSSDPRYNIQSEKIEGHSYIKFDKGDPLSIAANIETLRRYAGPYGSITDVMPV